MRALMVVGKAHKRTSLDESSQRPAQRAPAGAGDLAVSPRELTDEQERAVSRRAGSLLLAAGAGSGKTSVLVERFVRAVREDGVAPGQILAITFTERAAGELRERVRARLLDLDERELARETEAANVSTFHGFCARLLRTHPLQAGVEPDFQILEEGLADRLRALAFGDALADFLEGERGEAVDLVAAYGADPLRSMVVGAYAQLRSQGQSDPSLPVTEGGRTQGNPSLPATDGGQTGAAIRASKLIGDLLERFGNAYESRKHARAALDFDDLELLAGRLLAHVETVRKAWRERFQLLMVDEFQDSNPRQLEVLAALDRDNLFTVGDELQSIYGFRHADVSLFRERQARLSEREASLALTRNFRSRPDILAAAERIFAARLGERLAPLTPTRQPQPGEEPIVELLLTDKRGWERFPGDENLEGMPEATPWRQAEARLLADRVAELISNEQARAGEIVVLLRALSDLPVYESALRRRGLPTLADVGGFWSHQQVGDLLAWLRALANPLDELALYSTLASPLVGLSSDGLAVIAELAGERRGGEDERRGRAGDRRGGAEERRGGAEERRGGEGARRRGVWQTVSEEVEKLSRELPDADSKRLLSFRELFTSERASAASRPISELLRRVIAATDYDAYVLSLNWGERRFANVQKLVRLARRFEAQEGRDLRGFLDHVAHLELVFGGREADAPVGDGGLDAVRLMSIHAAKGLEFPVVCVADLGRDPSLRAPPLLVDGPSGRMGLRLLELGKAESESVLHYDELREERRVLQEEEEDRVLWVACTRAENRLLLSGSVAFERWPAPKAGMAPIVWLAPALLPDAPKIAASDAAPSRAVTVDTGDGLLVRCLFNTPRAGEDTDERLQAPIEETTPAPISSPAADVSSPTAEVLPTAEEMQLALALPTATPTPGPLADPDATISYTSLVELERCGYRYYLERVLGLPENRAAARLRSHNRGIEARTRGTIVHRLLQSIDFARPRAPSTNDVRAVGAQIGVRVDAGEREEIAALIANALLADPLQRLSAATRVRREHPFAFSLGSVHAASPAHSAQSARRVQQPLVTGVLDLIVEQPDGSSLIVDYKSDQLEGGEDLELLVRRDYSVQRLLYALAAIESGVEEVEVAHWFLERPRTWVSVRFLSGERVRLREQLLMHVERASAAGYTVTETPHRAICLTCPGRERLCSWGETRTMSERSTTLDLNARRDTLND